MQNSNGPLESRMDRNTVLRNNFSIFVTKALGKKVGRFHQKIIDTLERSDKHLHVRAPRGHFKTTIMSVCFPLWIAWRTEKPLNIGITSNSLSRSSEIMRLLKTELMNCPLLKNALYPDDIHHAIWSSTEIVLKNGHRIVCLPPGGVQGEHFDWLILDDIQRDEAGTGAELESTKRTFWQVIFPVINARKGRMIVVGTPLSYNDLYSELEQNPAFIFLNFPAVTSVNEQGEWVETLFPEHYSMDDLKKIRESLPNWAWQSQYMLNPIGAGTGLFPEELVRGAVDFTPIPSEYDNNFDYYMGCDIALSPDPRADRSCFVVVMRDRITASMRCVYKHIPVRGTNTETQIGKIHELANFYNCSKVVIEQKGLGYSLAQKAFSEIPYVEKFDTSKIKKEQILGNVELLLRNGKLGLLEDASLLDELMSFGLKQKKDGSQTFEALTGHDDQVMALALACYAAGGWVNDYKAPATLQFI